MGESPTASEVNQGMPFAGPSGHLLKQIMNAIDLNPDSVYYANSLLCNYKSEDKPKKDTVDACHPRLIWELGKDRMPNLNVVITVGGYALQSLTGKSAVTKEIYNVYWNEEIQAFVIPTYHPGFCFKNVEAFDDIVWAFKKAQELMHAPRTVLDPPTIRLKIATTVEQAEGLLWEIANTARPTWTAVDWESDDTDIQHTSTLALGFCQKPGVATIIPWVSDTPDKPDPRDFAPSDRMIDLVHQIARNKNVKTIFHNGDFDVRMSHHHVGCLFRIDYDTLLSSYALDERGGGDELEGSGGGVRIGSHRLKSDAKRYLGAPDWEVGIKAYLKNKKVKYSHIPRELLYKYLGYDVHYTVLLKDEHERLLLAEEPSRHGYWTPHDTVHRLLIPAQNELTQMELGGIYINRAKADEVLSSMNMRLVRLREQIVERAYALGWPVDQLTEFNIRSVSDLKELIYDKMGIKPTKELRTKLTGAAIKTEFPTGKDTLTKLRDEDRIFQLILDFKSLDKRRGTYVEAIIAKSGYDGKVHGEFTLTVARTGRLSSRGPNLQNIEPSTKEFYEPDDDSEFVNGDYKQLEVRVAARYSRDPNLIQACKGDIHGNISRQIFAKPYEDIANASDTSQLVQLGKKFPILFPMVQKVQARSVTELSTFRAELEDEVRNAAKPIIFGVIYGREAFSLANGPLQCTQKEAQKYIDNLFTRFSRLAKWLDGQKKEVEDFGWIEAETGRRRRFNYMNEEFVNKILKQTTNAPIQGFASDICLQGFINIAPILRETGWGRPLLLVHDAIGFSLKREYLDVALPMIKDKMETAVLDPDVRFEVDFKSGPNYGKLKKHKLAA